MATTQTLPQLVIQTKEITNVIVECGGELTTPELEAIFNDLQVKLPAKLDGYAILMERLEVEASYWKSKKEEAAKIEKGCNDTYEFLKERIKQAALELKTPELLGNDYKFSVYKNGQSVEINNEELIESVYKKEVITYKIDKKKIEEDLKLGLPVAGANLKDKIAFKKSANRKAGA